MDDPAEDTSRTAAAPRRLRRRTFHKEIPDTLLVPDVEPLQSGPGRSTGARRAAAADCAPGEAAYRRKRLVALLLVLIVALSVPTLIAALLLAG